MSVPEVFHVHVPTSRVPVVPLPPRLHHRRVRQPRSVHHYLEITLPRGLAEAILRAESLELITLQKNGPPANELEWNVGMIPGFDRDNEVATPIALASGDINANDVPTRQTPITSQGSFLPHSRLRLRVRNKANTAGVRSALVSAILLVKVTSS